MKPPRSPRLPGILALHLVIAAGGCTASPAWEPLAPMPEPNGGCVAGVVDGEIVVLGGTNWRSGTKHWLDVFWIYDPVRNVWRERGRLPVPLAYAAAAGDGSSLWFVGGTSGPETHRTLWQLAAKAAPRPVSAPTPGRVYAGGALIGSRLYVLGGSEDQAQLERLTGTLTAIDTATGTATTGPDYPEPGYFIGATAACGGQLYAFGGARWDRSAGAVINLASAHVFSPDLGRWSALPPLPAAVRGIAALPLDDRHVYLAGGYRANPDGFTAEAYLFDIRAARYLPAPPLPYAGMVALVRHAEWLYCLGGEDAMRHRTESVYRIRWQSLIRE